MYRSSLGSRVYLHNSLGGLTIRGHWTRGPCFSVGIDKWRPLGRLHTILISTQFLAYTVYMYRAASWDMENYLTVVYGNKIRGDHILDVSDPLRRRRNLHNRERRRFGMFIMLQQEQSKPQDGPSFLIERSPTTSSSFAHKDFLFSICKNTFASYLFE